MAGDVNGLTGAVDTIINDLIISACHITLLHEFIKDLPEGYNTCLSTNLSGGQKQHRAIAQAWMHNLTMLILGE